MKKMKRSSFILFVLALVCLTIWLASCTEEKIFDIVIGDSVCPDSTFKQNSASEVFTDTVYVQAGAEVDSTLARNGYSRADIKSAVLNGGYVTVTDFVVPDHPGNDWLIGGAILIQRTDGAQPGPEDTLITYTEQSVADAWGVDVTVPLHDGGVAIINQALEDFLEPPYTTYPAFRLVVLNGDCDPNPSANDRIIFEWLACLQVQLVGTKSTDALDPF
jgi:hypothetical protein